MKPIRPLNLITAAVLAAVAGFLFTQSSIANGFAFISTHPSLVLTLPITAVISLVLTRPLIRYRKQLEKYLAGELKQRPARVNPFYAVRVLALSKAVATAGAIFTGWHLGLILYWSLVNPANFWVLNLLGTLGGIMMVGAGILGERNCRASGGDFDNEEGAS